MALKSKFAKKNVKFKANKIFTDRTEPRTVFSESIADIISAEGETNSRQIITFYGKGGIGKTSLLKQLYCGSEKDVYPLYPQYRFHNVFISLEAYDYANPINVLTAIRSLIVGDGSLFDYALMQYYAKARVSMEEIKNKNSYLSPAFLDVLNDAIELCTASCCIPKALLEKGIDFIKDRMFRAKYKEDIQEIAELDAFEIFERLPYYLGLCITHSADNGIIHVLFMDSYESVQIRTHGKVSSVDSSEWLKELFLTCERTLFVIASRDRIDWDKQDKEWDIYLNQHLLSNLSDEDCRWFLEQVPIADADGSLRNDVIEDIILHSGGVPLYLDLCADLFEDSVNSGKEIDLSHFNGVSTIIERYMRHLRDKDQYSVSVLSMLTNFDCVFALKMLQKQNLIYHMGELYALLEKSIFISLDRKKGLWKVDESVRNHIFDQMMPKWRIVLLGNTLEVILENRSGMMYPYFSSVLEVLIRYPDYIDPIQDKVFEALEYFTTIGYWNELWLILKDQLSCENPKLKAVAVFTELIWLRRTGNLNEAEKFAHSNPVRKEDMGVWYYMYRFIETHVQHLLGNYDHSIMRYQELLDEMDLIRNVVPTHIYNTIALKYADLMFLKGYFDKSMELTEKLLSSPNTQLSDIIELLRIKGHIFRFQKRYHEAVLIYESALKLVLNNGLRAFEGKLYTNLAEANCLIDPEKALIWYEKAMERNIYMNNEIETGKAQAAGAVAMTATGRFVQGERLAGTAFITAESTGYQSGKVFALLAMSYAQKEAGKTEEMNATLIRARALVDKLNVYHFLIPQREVI